jgi:hypothetical protein
VTPLEGAHRDASSGLERELLAIGFAHVGWLRDKGLCLEVELGPSLVGVYVMVLDGQAFNIGESRSVRKRLQSYAKWLGTSYDKENERHKRERRAQDHWETNVVRRQLDIYVRPSDTLSLFGVTVHLNKPEEAALIERFSSYWNRRRQMSVPQVPTDAKRT